MTREEQISNGFTEMMKGFWGNQDLKVPDFEEPCKQEPCEDCISRKEVLDKIYNVDGMEALENSNIFAKHYADIVKFLPSVTPQSKTGRWTRELIINEYGGCIGAKMICSECGQDNGYDKRMKFCPNCGAKMEEEEC